MCTVKLFLQGIALVFARSEPMDDKLDEKIEIG
jgi:hypothetical protein